MADIFFNEENRSTIDQINAQSRNDFDAENEIYNKKDEQYLKDLQKYQVYLPQQQYDVINNAISNAEIPEDEAYRWASAIELSNQYGMEVADAYTNLEEIVAAKWGEDYKFIPKTTFKAIVDSGKLGVNTLKLGNLGTSIMLAEIEGNENLQDLIDQYRAIEKENESLYDYMDRNIVVEALKFGAQSAPFTGYVLGAGLIGSLIAPGVGTAAAFTASMTNATGLQYMQLREAGSDINAAAGLSLVSGALQSVVETYLGNVAGGLGESALGAASKQAITEKLTANLFKRLNYNGSMKSLAVKLGKEYLKENFEEGMEEVIQNLIEAGTNALAAEMGDYDIDGMTAAQIARESWENFYGGFLGSLVLGLPTSAIKVRADVKEFKKVRDLAEAIPSTEAFKTATKDSAIFEGMNESEKSKWQSEIHKNVQNGLDAELNLKAKENAEVIGSSEQFEQEQTDEETGDRIIEPEFRNEDTGKLHIQNEITSQEENGNYTGTYAAGNPTQENGNQYATIKYTVDEENKTVTIDELQMAATRLDLRGEVFDNFAQDFAGYEIKYDPIGKLANEWKQEFIDNNPSGVNNGLSYYSTTEAVEDLNTRKKVAAEIQNNIKNITDKEAAAGVALLEAAAKRMGYSITEYVDKTFGTNIFGAAEEAQRLAEAQNTTFQGKAGATTWKQLGRDIKAVIYAGENADFSTWCHELAHVFQAQLEGDLKTEAEAAFNVQNGDWINSTYNGMSSAEAFAYGFQDWLKTGKAENEAMKNIFQKFAEYVSRCFNAFKNFIQFTPEIESVYNQLLKGDDSMLAAAERAVEQQDQEAKQAEAAKKRNAEKTAAEEAKQQKQSEEEQRIDESEVIRQEETAEEEQTAEPAQQEETAENDTVAEALENTNLTEEEKQNVAEVLNDSESSLQEKVEAANEAAESVYDDENTLPLDYPLFQDEDIQTVINQSMTMEKAKDMVQRTFVLGNIREWYDNQYKNGDEWLAAEGVDEVAMYAENEWQIQEKFLNDIPGMIDGDFAVADILEAYVNKTLTGKVKEAAYKPVDLSKDTGFTDDRFYAPRLIREEALDLLKRASQKVTDANRKEVFAARSDFITAAHDPSFAYQLGMTQAAVNQKLRSWAAYPANAAKISNNLNKGVALQNKWTGIENSNLLKSLTISKDQLESMVKEVKGDPSEWQLMYLTSTILALDTHIDFSELTYEFNADIGKKTAAADYSRQDKTIRIKSDGLNTVAHETGHALDHKWGSELTPYDDYLTHRISLDKFTDPEVRNFVAHFYDFLEKIEAVADNRSEYTMGSHEVFARFVARFTEWARATATNNRYNFESQWYNDKFNTTHYTEFVKLLQEKSALDTRNGNAKAVEKLKELVKNTEYELNNVSQPIDLTSEFADITNGTITEQDIEDRLNSLINQAYDTATTPIQIQVIGKHKRHIATSNVQLKGTKEARHNAAVYTLELIINNAERDDVRTAAEGAVDLTHNTSKKTLARKQKVDSYVYFNSPVIINGQNYNVELVTEKIKGQDPDLLDLYNVRVKKSAVPNATQNVTSLAGANNSNVKSNNQNVNSPLLYQDEVEKTEAERQEEAVRKQYENTEKWLKAPNGKDSNLTEKQWLQTRTDNFKRWFGDWENDPENASKVVDENGEPKVVYHGTKDNFTTFSTRKTATPQFWFTDSKELIERGEVGAAGKGIIMPVFLDIKKPAGWHEEDNFGIDQIIARGFDGKDLTDAGVGTYVAFNPNQIKSATDNNGNFDANNPSILFQDEITQVTSDNFKKWFGDWQNDLAGSSKVTDDDGRPMVVYHGTNAYIPDIKKFKKGTKGYLGPGMYFTNSIDYARRYTDFGDEGLMRLFLNIRNPLTVSTDNPAMEILQAIYGDSAEKVYKKRELKDDRITNIITKADIEKLKAAGYDGIIWNLTKDIEYSVFDQTQIKSSDANNGEYDPQNPNIYFQEAETDTSNIDTLIFQTEAELYADARTFSTWQEFMDYYETMGKPEVTPIPYDADAQYYQTVWELAHKVTPEESINEAIVEDRVKNEGTVPTALDSLFVTNVVMNDEALIDFLETAASYADIDLNSDEYANVATEEEAQDRQRISDLQDYMKTIMYSRSFNEAINALKAGHDVPANVLKSVRGEMRDNFKSRDFRALYAEVMGDEQYAVDEKDTVTAVMNERRAKNPERYYDIVKPDEDISRYSPEKRKQISLAMDNADLAAKIKSGKLKMNDEVHNYIKNLDKEIAGLKKDLRDQEIEQENDFKRIADAERRELLRLHDKMLIAKNQYNKSNDEVTRKMNKGIRITSKYKRESQNLKANYDELFRKFNDLKSAITLDTQIQEALKRQEQVHQIREDINTKQQEKSRAAEEKKLRISLVKRTMRRIDFSKIDYEDAKTIVAIQRLFEPNLLGGVNRWIGTEGPFLRGVISGILTDVEYKEQIEKYLRNNARSSQAYVDFVNLLKNTKSLDDFNKWTQKDRKAALRYLPKENWIRDLNLVKLAREREESIDLDIDTVEVQKPLIDDKTGKVKTYKNADGDTVEATTTAWKLQYSDEIAQRVKDAIGADMFNNLINVPFADWTFEQLEELATRINGLYKQGRDLLEGKKIARKEAADRIRQQIESVVKNTGIIINDDDDDETKKRKQEKINKILGLTSSNTKGSDTSKDTGFKARVNRLLHSYNDANVLRVARILDGYNEGTNVNELYRKEDSCYINKTRSINQRAEKINKIMQENKITSADLATVVQVTVPSYDTVNLTTVQEYTIDDLLYFAAAAEDYELDDKGAYDNFAACSRNAVMYGNMFASTADLEAKQAMAEDEEVDELGQSISLKTYISRCNERFNAVLKAAQDLDPKYQELVKAIQEDYAAQYDRMNKVSVEQFNQPVHRVKAYVPLNRLESNGDDNINRVREDLLASMGANATKKGVDKGMTARRVRMNPFAQKPVVTGLYKTWAESVDRTEHFIAYAEYVNELNRVYKYRDANYTRQFIENRYGKGMLRYIDDYINEVANPGANKVREAGAALLHTLRGRTAPAYLAWKASAIIKQGLTSPWPFMQYINPAEYMVASWKAVTSHGQIYKAIREKSVYMNNRVMDPMNDMIDEMAEHGKTKFDRIIGKQSQIGMAGLEWIDWVCVAPGWYAAYTKKFAELNGKNQAVYEAVKQRLEEENAYAEFGTSSWKSSEQIEAEAMKAMEDDVETKAVQYADDITRACQPSNRSVDISPLFKNSSEAMKAYLQFQTSLNVIWQNLRYDLPYAVKKEQFMQVAGCIVGYALAGIFMNSVMDGVPDDDEDKLKALIYYATTQFTDAVPMIGSELTNTMDKLITGKQQYMNSGTDMTPTATKIFSILTNAKKGNWEKAAEMTAEGIGMYLGLPVSGAKEIKKLTGVGDKDSEPGLHLDKVYGILDKED